MSTLNTPSDATIHETAVVEIGAQIGKGSKIWHFSHIMGGAVLGENCNVGQNVFIDNGVTIGSGVKIQNNVSVYKGVEVADDCFLGPSVVFTNVINPRAAVVRRTEFKKTTLKKGVSIGANATIVCGVTLGEYAFVGAGAVVTEDVGEFELVLGIPARCVGWMSEFGERLNFDEVGIAICGGTGDRYSLVEGKVKKLN
jgi:UDP-2-acetamido-3-amino-2,3-dideoxy-glucuronate N-acetyltransferase